MDNRVVKRKKHKEPVTLTSNLSQWQTQLWPYRARYQINEPTSIWPRQKIRFRMDRPRRLGLCPSTLTFSVDIVAIVVVDPVAAMKYKRYLLVAFYRLNCYEI